MMHDIAVRCGDGTGAATETQTDTQTQATPSQHELRWSTGARVGDQAFTTSR